MASRLSPEDALELYCIINGIYERSPTVLQLLENLEPGPLAGGIAFCRGCRKASVAPYRRETQHALAFTAAHILCAGRIEWHTIPEAIHHHPDFRAIVAKERLRRRNRGA